MIDNTTHSILFELQKNLEDLSSAKTQMEEFRTSSVKVVQGINSIRLKYVEYLENIKSDYEKKVNNLTNELTSFISTIKDENTKSIQKVVIKSEESIEKGIEKIEFVSKKIESSNNEKIETINNLLKHYKNVVEASNSLIDTLTTIDFPTKLDAISTKSQLIIEAITNSKQALEIKSNEAKDLILEKATFAKEQIIQNSDSKINSLTEKLIEVNSNLGTELTEAFEKQLNLTNERLNRQDKELRTLKTTLFVTIGIIIIGIALNFVLK